MKATIEKTENIFRPITLTITMETENDALWFKELFNITKGELCKHNDTFRGIVDPDPNGDLSDMIGKMMKQ